MAADDRIVVLIDMDCFYVQVEQRRQPSVRGKPSAVVQYNKWKGGGIIAVSYEARAKGVTRQMRGDDAKQKCPEIVLLQVPTANGKADLTRYRDAGAEVISVLLQFGGTVERASIDEAYIDLTNVVNEKFNSITSSKDFLPDVEELKNTHVVGFPKEFNSENQDSRLIGLKQYLSTSCNNKHVARLSFAASIVENMRQAIWQQTSFRCSAGISHNKMLSKLACGINKPNKQTILPMDGVPELFQKVKIGKIRNLGGKLGASLAMNFKVDFIGQVADISSENLVNTFGAKTGSWLSEVCHGIDHEPVKERHIAQSVGCSKNFTGSDALDTRAKVKHWVQCLITELVERLNKDKFKNNRVAYGLTLHVGHSRRRAVSRSCRIEKYEADHVTACCLATLELLNDAKRDTGAWTPPITMLGISSKSFKSISGDGSKNVASMLSTQSRQKSPTKPSSVQTATEDSGPTENQVNNNSIDSFIQKASAPTLKTQDTPSSNSAQYTKNIDTTSQPSHTSSPKKSLNVGTKTSPLLKTQTKSSFFSRLKSSSTERKTPEPNIAKGNNMNSLPTNKNTLINTASPKKEESTVETLKQDIAKDANNDKPLHNDPDSTTCENNAPKNSVLGFSYAMSDIDREVFDSLPLHLQQEIQSSARRTSPGSSNRYSSTTTSNRKRPPNSPNKQNSISKFLRPSSVNFAARESKKAKDQNKPEEKNKKKRPQNVKKNAHTVYDATSVPLGFFRARSQTSAAIRNALQESHNQGTGKISKVIPAKKSTSVKKSIWNSTVANAGPCYKCDECCCMVPISEVSSHSEFHEKRNRENAQSAPQES
uniref:DNA polymerase eta n=1 Tax=Phallusia mammillata TaxID=59560 RepID=A0A6F9DPT6_9ASCI|nr:DNA polymerase eta [Phallusia mammillata]